jgi:hypothetical protein
MSVRLVTPFTQVNRRSVPIGAGALLTGRWATLDANGLAIVPGAVPVIGGYLILEGSLIHVGDETDFSGSAPYASTDSNVLPSVAASGQVALAYGVFVFEVGPEGCDPTHAFSPGDLVTIDAYGRIIAASGGNQIGKVEAVSTDASALVTLLRIRTLGI